MSETPHIFLIDDDRQMVGFMTSVLGASGYQVTGTTTGKDVLESLKSPPPDLLILDLNMPAPDGFDLLKAIRNELPYLRILVISGYLQGSLLEAASFLGAYATLEKPFTEEALLAKVKELLG